MSRCPCLQKSGIKYIFYVVHLRDTVIVVRCLIRFISFPQNESPIRRTTKQSRHHSRLVSHENCVQFLWTKNETISVVSDPSIHPSIRPSDFQSFVPLVQTWLQVRMYAKYSIDHRYESILRKWNFEMVQMKRKILLFYVGIHIHC